MKKDFSGAGPTALKLWNRLSPLPGGKLLFSRILGQINPYTGSVKARWLELGPGHAVAQIHERRSIRNHVGSVHAIALTNLAEMVSGLALMSGLPAGARGIPVRVEIDFLKKARGVITGEGRCDPPATAEEQEVEVWALMRDEGGQEVARARAVWKVGPGG